MKNLATPNQNDGVPVTPSSPWAPFRFRAFTILWVATVVSNIGTWMNDVGAGWLMASLDPSPSAVSLVQAATTLPVFLFALLAGALADMFDRRKLLMLVNVIMAATASAFALLVYLDAATPTVLIGATFILGTCTAFVAPAWQAIVPSLVPRHALQAAIALNSTGINVSRAIGPALAGVIIVSIGIYAPFALNAVSFIGILIALFTWKMTSETTSALPREHVIAAMMAGARYALHSAPLRATIGRAVAFFLFASAYWALLPLIAKTSLGGDARSYGILVGAVGVGAVLGALVLPRLRRRFGPDNIAAAGTLGTACVLVVFAIVPNLIAAAAGSLLAGASWIAVLSTLNASAQTALPSWVRARGLSVFITIFFGAMSLGSIIWGQVAQAAGIPAALIIAATGAVILIPVTWRLKLGLGEKLDLAPSAHWPAPVVVHENAHDRSPAMTMIMYHVPAKNHARFLVLATALSQARKRSGAYRWGLMQDAEHPDQFSEYFLETSWLNHLRHHERVSGSDRVIQDEIRTLLKPETTPVVTHLLGTAIPAKSKSATSKGSDQ
ncbi:MFS transporter [uncultured Thalassospira sp.]|uniref:MFS transporter n=1 Tax=uncultured Thalassospira sp. TaxID=404382 RepID=UPI0030DA0DD7|tara:strand:+ start:273 stop:1937 length:1665 start_codon:yes stop_codon:yes gene_type:complete